MFNLHLIKQAQKEILKMPASLKDATFEALKQLERQGNQLKEPNVRDMGNGLKELRASSKDGISRSFFFFTLANKSMLFTHYIKKHPNKI
ncbi:MULTISPECIES: type II toxin-antitoxin system RelE/ParE family toxin [unclassified Lonepinella]|uniref:type II toxin-antitoxin system RelE/ParE family toxin n=1 Tax=unclassified Lonepinella TaxID=2642006 RepID=UPI003F6DACC0